MALDTRERPPRTHIYAVVVVHVNAVMLGCHPCDRGRVESAADLIMDNVKVYGEVRVYDSENIDADTIIVVCAKTRYTDNVDRVLKRKLPGWYYRYV